jgi:hypothetical protein
VLYSTLPYSDFRVSADVVLDGPVDSDTGGRRNVKLSVLRILLLAVTVVSGAFIERAVALLSDQRGFAPVNRLLALFMHQLDVVKLHILVDHVLHQGVLEGASNDHILCIVEILMLLQHFSQLALHSVQDATDLTGGNFGRDGERRVFLVAGLVLLDLVLGDFLLHDLVIEFHWVLVGQVIVDLSALGLDYVALSRGARVVELVGLLVPDVGVDLLLVLPCSFFMGHESLCWADVTLGGLNLIEVRHQGVEVVRPFNLEINLFAREVLLIVTHAFHLSFNGGVASLKLGVEVLVAAIFHTSLSGYIANQVTGRVTVLDRC